MLTRLLGADIFIPAVRPVESSGIFVSLSSCESNNEAYITLLAASTTVYGMDRWAALSQIESGDNDLAVGQGGEGFCAYRIKPALWCSGRTVGL